MTTRYFARRSWLIGSLAIIAALLPPTVDGFYAQPEAVSFTFSPSSTISCLECGPVELSCGLPRQRTAANLPYPEISWMHNENLISDAAIVQESNITHVWSTLTLSNPTHHQSGMYRCKATDGHQDNHCGRGKLTCVTTVALSNEANVQIISEVEMAENVHLTNCFSTLLRCKSLSEQTSWTRDGLLINHTTVRLGDNTEARIDLLQDGTLVLNNDGNVDLSGVYECKMTFAEHGIMVTAASYNVTSGLAKMDDEVSVEVVSSKSAYLESDTVTLVCAYSVNSTTCPHISWHYNGTLLSNNSSKLILELPTIEQTGLYCCTLEGKDSKSCLHVHIYPDVGALPVEVDTRFPNSLDSTFLIDSTLPISYSLAWYHNGMLLEEESNASLSLQNTENVYGTYQCFIAVPDHPQTQVILTRIMPPDQVNPPSRPRITYLVRAEVRQNVPYRFSWDEPLYTGAYSKLHYKVEDTFFSGFYWNGTTPYIELVHLVGLYRFYVEVVGSSGSTISDRSDLKFLQTSQQCTAGRVLFPPLIALSCDRGQVDITLTDNNEEWREPNRYYYITGTCTHDNTSTTIEEELESLASLMLQFFPTGTNCILTVAATTEYFPNCTTNPCFCVDPSEIQYSEPVECTVTGTVMVNFAQDVYEISESEEAAQLCITMQTMEVLDSGIMVNVHGISGSAQAGADFELPMNLVLIISGGYTCFNISVYDDNILENSENFSVVLSSTNPLVHITNGKAEFWIVDNDNVTLSLRGPSEVLEGDRLELCADLEGELERNVTVLIETSSGTAEDAADYEGFNRTITFTPNQASECVNINITDDQVPEDRENFTVTLNTSDSSVVILTQETQINIKDNDEDPTYSELIPIIAGSVFGTATFLVLFAVVFSIVLSCVVCRNRNMTFAEKQVRITKYQPDPAIEIDEPVGLLELGMLGLGLTTKQDRDEDQKSEYQLYFESGSEPDIISLERSPLRPRNMLVSQTIPYCLKDQLFEETNQFLRDSANEHSSSDSGVSSADYIYWKDEVDTMHSPDSIANTGNR